MLQTLLKSLEWKGSLNIQSAQAAEIEFSDSKRKRWLRRAMSHCKECDRAKEYTVAFELSSSHSYDSDITASVIGTSPQLVVKIHQDSLTVEISTMPVSVLRNQI